MKPTIDQQIEAVETAGRACYQGDILMMRCEQFDHLRAALETLKWVKLKTKPALGSVMEAFPGAKVVSQDGEE
jgi:hypothetical protein